MSKEELVKKAKEDQADAQRVFNAICEGKMDFDDFYNGWLDQVKYAEYEKAYDSTRADCHDFLMDLHAQAKGRHNYYHVAANRFVEGDYE